MELTIFFPRKGGVQTISEIVVYTNTLYTLLVIKLG